jgi:hypothetical protein
MSGGDGTDSSTQVPTVSCEWALVAMSCHVQHKMPLFPEVPAPMVLTRYRKPPGVSLAGGMRQSGLTSGEFLPTHDYQDRGIY